MSDATIPTAPPSSALAGDDPLEGTSYRFISHIGKGGMGEVVLAEHRTLGSLVAVKLLRADDFARFELKDRMRLEAQTSSRIRHDNLVLVTDFGETLDGRPFIVMELLQGCSLGDELRRRRVLPVPEALDIVAQALAGLSAAHAAGVVHRDVKPDNLFLCDLGEGKRRVKVLDFGIAKIVAAAHDPRTPVPLMQPTAEGMTVGSPRYASPEQGRGERDIDARSDVYSMGLVLYALLTGREPFPELRTHAELARAHHTQTPPVPSSVAPQVIAPNVDGMVMKAIAKRREDRFASAEAFRAELTRPELGLILPVVSTAAATSAQSLKGTEIIDPTNASAMRAGLPAPRAHVATVALGPSGSAMPADAARTVNLDPGAPTLQSAGVALTSRGLPDGTVDPSHAAPSRPALPWERAASRPSQERRVNPLLICGVIALVAGVAALALNAVGAW